MIALVILMTGFSMAIEFSLVRKFPAIRRLMENQRVGPYVGLGFSFGLSIMLGTVFGAAGLIVMLGGVMSTVCMQPLYAIMRNGQWAAFERKLADRKAAAVRAWNAIQAFCHDVAIILKIVIAICAIPVWIVVKAISIIARVCEWLMTRL